MSNIDLKRRTKIVATIGPATQSEEIITNLIKAGVTTFRLNFSHGDHKDHAERIKTIREVSKKLDIDIGILQDLQGPKIRLGRFKDGPVKVKKGDKFTLTSNEVECTNTIANVTYDKLSQEVSEGKRILLDDGKIEMIVEKVDTKANNLECMVTVGGVLSNNKGVNFPDVQLSVKALTEKDKEDLKFGLSEGVDWIALSFVRNPSDINEIKDLINKNGHSTPVVAKIEKFEAIDQIDAVLPLCDGVMVARGDLGVQLDLEKVPFIQKQILNEANAKGKITVTATEMLQSMKESHRPTRAEVTDITNAILEGTDCVMLSAETAIGNHPEVVVSAMSDICKEADSRNDTSVLRFKETSTVDTLTTSLAKAAVQVANEIEAKAIVAFTETGRTPLLISNYRPEAPIFTMTTIDKTYNQMNILWGVQQIKIDRLETTPEMFEIADTWLQNNKKFKKNDKVVIVAGTPPNKEAATNLIRVMKIGEF